MKTFGDFTRLMLLISIYIWMCLPPDAVSQEMTLSTLTLTPVSPSDYAAVLSPVYMDGNLLSPSPTNSLWGMAQNTTEVQAVPFGQNCLNGCSHLMGLAGATYLEVSFAAPVDSVSITEFANPENSTGFQAFNSSGQIIENCTQFVGNCYHPNASPPNDTGGVFTFTDPGAIAYVLATSYDVSGSQIGEVSFVSLPEPGTALLLFLGLLGLGCYRRR